MLNQKKINGPKIPIDQFYNLVLEQIKVSKQDILPEVITKKIVQILIKR